MSDDEEPKVVYSEQVLKKMAEDPKLAEAVRNFAALSRQVMEGVKTGKYKTFDDGMEILTGSRPVPQNSGEENGE